jgi:RHS repeat-associated protein
LSGDLTLDGASYTVDNAGNRTSKLDKQTGLTTNYGYDAIYQLTSATQGATTTESYAYDTVGNRTSSLSVASYTTNSSNQLTATSNASYGYDNNGNTTSKTDSSGTTSYAWDFENRLTSVTLPGTSGSVSFKYDPFGRRIYKSSSSGTSVFTYGGDNLIEETSSIGTVIARYSQGLKIDEPVAMLRSSATSYYNADGLGSITSLANSSGTLAQTYTFDSFGKQTAAAGSLTNPFQYTARESDSETGMYFYRARNYDTGMGRFISEDPIQSNGGLNFYVYVRNNPSNRKDPRGLKPNDKPSPDPFWPLSWGICELAGPRMPIAGWCMYSCDWEGTAIPKGEATTLLPMDGLLGLKSMCGAKLSCPSKVAAVKLSLGYGFGPAFGYTAIH